MSGKPFVHSFSATKKFKQCRRIFHEDRVLRKYPFVQGESAKRGDAVHLALSNFIGRSIVLPAEWKAELEDYAKALKGRAGVKKVEMRLGIRKDFTPCDYFDKEVYARCIIDYFNLNTAGNVVLIVDHKTGKDGYPDVDQLLDNAVIVFAHYPEVERIKGVLAFVDHGTNANAEFDREYLEDYQNQLMEDWSEIDIALETQEFPYGPGPLCPWCPKTDCPHWSPPRKK